MQFYLHRRQSSYLPDPCCKRFISNAGFATFEKEDQATLIRLGQSPSRILVAATNWYDAEFKQFRNFLTWRESRPGHHDGFKQLLLDYAERITQLGLDTFEGALFNALIVIATGMLGVLSCLTAGFLFQPSGADTRWCRSLT